MLVGLALRFLSRWLQDHVGIDVENADCDVKYLGSSHVVVRLQDVSLTEALWSFFVGPLLPITTHSGRVQEVVVEISSEAFRVEAKGVTLRLRKMDLPEIVRVANGHRARTLRDRDRLLSGNSSQREIKRWVKGKMQVSVTDLAVVLHDETGPSRCGPCSLAFLCKSIVLGDPDDASASARRSALPAQGDDAQLPVVPFHLAGRDALYQMAKDIFVTETRLFLTVGRPLPEDYGEAGSWRAEDAICPSFSLYVAYRAWDPGALAEFPSVAQQAKKTLVLQVCPLEPAAECLPSDACSVGGDLAAAPPPFLLTLDARQFSFLGAFLGNLDSLYFAWSVALAESTKDISMKPSGPEVLRYVELWRQYRAAPAFGRSRELCNMEWRFAGCYTARMRVLAQTVDAPLASGGVSVCCTTSSASLAAGEAEVGRLQSPSSGAEGFSPRPRRAIQLTPRISAEVLRECFCQGGAANERRPSLDFKGDEGAPNSGQADSAKAHSGGALQEFVVDSAYRIIIPDFGLKLNCTPLDRAGSAESSALAGDARSVSLAERAADLRVSLRGVLRIHLPRFCLNLVRDLDNRHVSLTSQRAQLDVSLLTDSTSRSSSSHTNGEEFSRVRSEDSLRRSSSSGGRKRKSDGPRLGEPRTLLDWRGLEISTDYFGDNFREIGIRGEVSLEFPTLWPCLQDFPGFRPIVDCVQVFNHWYPDEELPTELREVLAPEVAPRQSIYVVEVPTLRMTCLPGSKELPPLELLAAGMVGQMGPAEAWAASVEKVSIRCPGTGLPGDDLPMLALKEVGLDRAALQVRQEPLCVTLPQMQVNLTPYLLHVFANHWQAYDPRPILRSRARSAEPPKEAGDVPSVPNLRAEVQTTEVRLWDEAGVLGAEASHGDDQKLKAEPRAQLCVRGLELGAAGGGPPAREEAVASVHLKIAGLLGDLQSCEGANSVFLCSHLDGVPLHDEDACPAISAGVTWTASSTELVVGALFLHFAPTSELVQQVRMLVPGALGGKTNANTLAIVAGARPLPVRSGGSSSSVLHVQERLFEMEACRSATPPWQDPHQARDFECPPEPDLHQRPPPAAGDAGAGGTGGGGKARVLRINGLCVGLHFSAWGQEPVLLRMPEATGPCGAGAVGTLDSAYVGAQGLSLSMSSDSDSRTVEACSGCLHVSVVRRHASGWDMLPSVGQPAPDSSRGVELVWIAALESIAGVAVLPLPGTGSGSAGTQPRALRAGALRIQDASLWSTDVASELFTDGSQGVHGPRADALCALCPFVPKEYAMNHLCQLLSSRGPDPWITLSLNGALVSACAGAGSAAAEGFYGVEAFLCGGSLCYKKVDGALWMTCTDDGEWKMAARAPEPDRERELVAVPSKLCSPAGSPRCSGTASTEQAGQEAGVPQSFHVALSEDGLVVQLRLAPMSLVIPKLDVSPVVRFWQQVKRLQDEVREPKAGEASGGCKSNVAEVEAGEQEEEPPVWQFFVEAELSVTLKDRAACPVMRLRCTPRPKLTSSTSICELRHASLELLHGARAADGQAQVSLNLNNIQIFRPSPTPDMTFAVSVASISGRQLLRERHSTFVRKFDHGMHLKVKYSSGKELFLYLAPTAVRLHRDWMEPLVILLTGLGSLYRASKFTESRKVGFGIDHHDSWADPRLMWEGPLWELAPEGPAAGQAPARRRWMQVMVDGFMKDVQAPLRPCLYMKSCMPRPSALFGLRLRTVEMGTLAAYEFAFDTQRDASILRQLMGLLRSPESHLQHTNSSLPAPLPSAPSKKSEHNPTSEPSSISRIPSMLNPMQVAGRMSASLQWIANGSSNAASNVHSPRVGSEMSACSSSYDASPASNAEPGMSIYVEVRSLEFWLPTSADPSDDERELGFLAAAEAHGVTGIDVVATMHHLVAMHARPGCWQGWEEDAESEPEPVDPEDHEAILESSFAPITHWTPNEGVGTSPIPGSPMVGGQAPRSAWDRDMPSASRSAFTPLWQLVLGDTATGGGAWPAGKLMEARGLALVLLWEPRPTAGVRLEGVDVRVPAELLQGWPVIKEHIAALRSHGKEKPGSSSMDSPVSIGVPHDQAIPKTSLASAELSVQPPSKERGVARCLPCQAVDFAGKARAPNNAPASRSHSSLEEADAERQNTEPKEKPRRIWKFEFDVSQQVEITFSGGLLAPAHWLQARFSDVMVRGNLPLQEGLPLGGVFRCDVACYDGQTAQLEPVLEPVEITVDVLRRNHRDEYCLSMARVNLNVHRVLVDFLETVRRKLRDTASVLLRPLRTLQIKNETGVLLRLQWPDTSYSVDLPDDEMAMINMPALDDRGVRLSFFSEQSEQGFQLEDDVMIELDYKNGRAYLLRASRCVVFVEPRHDVQEDGQCTCALHVRSAVSIHNNTAIPLHIYFNQPHGLAPLGLARDALSNLVSNRSRDQCGPLVIQPYSRAKCVPLSWFTTRGGTTQIKPAAGDIPQRSFAQLSNLLEGRLPDEDSLEERLQKPASSTTRQLGERMKFNLFFPTYMKLIGYVNAYDVPMSEVEDMLPAQRYEMHLENVVSFRNMLPFPVIVQLCAIEGVLEAQEFPIEHVHQAFHGQLPCADQEDTSPTLDLEASSPGVRCFAREESGGSSGSSSGAHLQRRTELDNILQLTMGRTRRGKEDTKSLNNMVASYVLGVDQELKLPFAKRSLHFRLLALCETGSGMAGPEQSVGVDGSGKAAHPLLASVTQCMFLPPVHSDKLWVTLWERGDCAPPPPVRRWCPGLAPPEPPLGGCQSLQVGLELTRNAVVLFAPIVLENLTPFSLHIHPEETSCLLEPFGRRALPRSQQLRDAVYFAVQGDETSAAGQELVGASGAHPPGRAAPVLVPAPAASGDCGLWLDSLSLGLCVRTGAAPLRLTKVVSIVPRFFVRSELEQQVNIHFDGYPDCQGRLLVSNEKGIPLHPPSKSYNGEGGPRVYLTDGSRKSNAFAVEQWRKEDSENKRNFHVRMGTTSFHSSQPHFVQVDIHQAVFPGEDHVLHADCYFIVFRAQDFRGSEDSLFHVENCTPLSFFARFAEQRAVLIEPMGSDGHASHQWVHQADGKDLKELKDKDKRYPAALEIYQDFECKRLLQSVDLEKVAEFRPNAVVANFTLQALVQRWSAKEAILGRIVVNGLVTLPSEVGGFSVAAELTFQSIGPPERARVFIVRVGRVGAQPEEAEAVRVVFQDRWCLRAIGDQPPEPGGEWRRQLLQGVPAGLELRLEVCVDVRHFEGADGVHHFALQSATDTLAALTASSSTKGLLKISCPVFSVSWVYNSYEVLAARVKGVDLQLTRDSNDERNDDCGLEVSAQHLQVDHFLEGELPVVLNRRFLHINSRLLGKKAFFMKVNWVLGSRSIHLLRIDVVPYWLNLEIGVLIRLWDLAEGSFSSMLQRSDSKAVPLEEPLLPSSGEEGQAAIWRLMKLVIEPLKVTIMVRSPDPASVRDNPTARWILRLPTDMPNMDLFLPTIKEPNILGTTHQLLGWLSRKYTKRVKYSALWSIFLSYAAAILKGLLNALWWLARGPYDAINVAQETRLQALAQRKEVPLFWWISPAVHGVAEGTYRAMAELLGNSIFGVVLILNAIRQGFLNTTRPRAQSILDGFVYGFRGLVLDTLFTPIQQLLLQTQIAFQDWGIITATVVFCLSLIRLPFGPLFGVTHFVACSCEGLVNILLLEEAQFAPFEPQRVVEGESLRPSVDMRESVLGGPEDMHAAPLVRRRGGPDVDAQRADLPRKWWLFPRLPRQLHRVTRAIADDDEVMENFQNAIVQQTLRH